MFTNMTIGFDVDEEIKLLTQQYSLLDDGDKELVRQMINSLAEKTKQYNKNKRA